MNEFRHIMRELAEERQLYEESILKGNLDDFAEYKFLAGTIRGLVLAESIVTDLVQKLEKSDD
jgi:hypothetical protein